MSVQRATSSAEDALAGSICIVEGNVELLENRIAELYVSLSSSDYSSKPFTREAQNTLLVSKLADTQRYEKLQIEPMNELITISLEQASREYAGAIYATGSPVRAKHSCQWAEESLISDPSFRARPTEAPL